MIEGAIHISGPTAPPGAEDSDHDVCCIGAVMRGDAYCTCWEPVFDLEQAESAADRVFWCHQRMRKVIAWRHPDGRELPAGPEDDYKPLIIDGVPYLADGTPGERCAGWAAHRTTAEAA